MTNPLTTPSGVEQSIPIPRNADGSPMTKAQARIIRARTIQKQVLAGQHGAVAEATSDEARQRPEDHTSYLPSGVTSEGHEEPKLAEGLPYDAGPRMLSPEEVEQRLAAAEADPENYPKDFDPSKVRKSDVHEEGPANAFPKATTTVPERLKQTDESLPVQLDPQDEFEAELEKQNRDEHAARGGVTLPVETEAQREEREFEEELAKEEAAVKPENPRQPPKKTPAQKRADTIAAKKAAAEGNA